MLHLRSRGQGKLVQTLNYRFGVNNIIETQSIRIIVTSTSELSARTQINLKSMYTEV